MDFWRQFVAGGATRGSALAAALACAAAGLVLALAVARPLLKLLLSREEERDRDTRIRRRTTPFLLAAVALGFYVYFHSTLPPDVRRAELRFQLAELALITIGGYAVAELALLLFFVFLPAVRGRSPLAPILQDLARLGLVVAVSLVGIRQAFPTADIGALITTSAILSIVLGLALQESLSNVFGGIMLTIDRPFKPGDWVSIDGQDGKVIDSNWRSTRLLTTQDDVIYVPNSTLAKSNVINYTAPDPIRQIERDVGVEYAAPPNRVCAVLTEMMKSVDGVLAEPPPDVYVKDYGESAIVYQLRFWISDLDERERIESDVMRSVWYHLKRQGISIPFPVRDVYLKRDKPERRDGEILEILRKVEILKPLGEGDLVLLAGDIGHQLFARGEKICRQGDVGSTFYILKSGSIAVTVKSEGGAESEVARLGPGACFGEMALLTGEPRSSTCTAADDVELLFLDRGSFETLLRANPPVAQAISEILASRVAATQAKLAADRETQVRRAPNPAAAAGILEKIKTIFRFRR
jgi:small-conductance mechanosensitive channel